MKEGRADHLHNYIARGRNNHLVQNLSLNNTEIAKLENEDHYKYLGQDEITKLGYTPIIK